ncbi:acyltransferase family protein [Burkholderia cenocepacia]|uniref:acyltransferase family protein n=1 Tax=Burkholderia cenocepacia TaxID=95486 RepID=UPI002232BDAD|nr:acyltransferase [Burkholderia cenocepacia]MCW3542944.1 acyltransferase [Burkholderia cenocepacia]
MKYRPELDTLRAIAVVAVMLSHWVPGFAYPINWGLVGVYVFFSISGYVITRGLLSEQARSGGSIDLRWFFARRVIRIWPIYFLTIAFIYFVYPGFVDGGMGWHMLFLSNIFFSLKGAFLFPVHFWSLSVEQQFYLAWPFILIAYHRRNLMIVIAAMMIVSPLSRWYFDVYLHNIQAAFYAPNSNLDCLAAGALVAVAEIRKSWDRALNAGGALGAALLAFIVTMSASGNDLWNIALTGTAIAMISAWLIAWLGRSSKRSRALCNPVSLYIGRISYGMYLYHLMIGSYIFYGTPIGKLPIWVSAISSVAITVAIASMSWHFIERPLLSIGRGSAREGTASPKSGVRS